MGKKYDYLLLLASITVILIGLSPSMLAGQAQVESNVEFSSNVSISKFKGLCYGPHRDNENPDFGIQPTISELSEDLAFIQNLTITIRTYGATDNLEQIPLLCQQYGIDCYPGAWISKFECENERQIDSLIQIANLNLSHVKGLIVGNEVLLRNDISEQKLIEFITKVRNSTNLPVATAEIWFDWLEHPQIAEAVDILFVHIYAYWDGVAVEEGANYVLEKWNELRARYPDKTIVIGETGWPSQGEIRGNAIPSEENQKKYLSDFITMAESNNIDYFYFEIFDEKWKVKGEGDVGSHWGLYYSNGTIKPLLQDLVPEQAQEGINRPAREVKPTEATLPLYVYSDGCDPQNSFHASGWMGELASYGGNDSTFKDPTEILDQLSTENPYSGETCIRISYTPSPGKWGGIYWQFPVNNWGKYPGYDLSKSVDENTIVKLKFRVKGAKGGEKAEFKTGGIDDPSLPYRDSYGPISTGVKTLSTAWEADSLMLTGHDLSMVIGGFVWVTNYAQNPQGSTIYLDEIVFEIMNPTAVNDKRNTIPTKFFLAQNYPNPFNPSTTISYQLKENAEINISIYNISGQNVATLIDKRQQTGTHSVKWDGYDGNGQMVSNGIYVYRLMANRTLIDSRKMILLK